MYGRLPEGRKWVSHKGFCLTSGNRTNVPTSLGRVNPNTAAAEIRTRRLAHHQAATRTQVDWNSVCPRRNPGVRTAPGRTPGIVQTLCRPFRAFRWFPIHKQPSNSTVPVSWISEHVTDSLYPPTLFACVISKCPLAWTYSDYTSVRKNLQLDICVSPFSRILMCIWMTLQITARLLAFMLFAVYWGPGNIYPLFLFTLGTIHK